MFRYVKQKDAVTKWQTHNGRIIRNIKKIQVKRTRGAACLDECVIENFVLRNLWMNLCVCVCVCVCVSEREREREVVGKTNVYLCMYLTC